MRGRHQATVLVVEDDPMSCLLVRELLTPTGHEILCTHDMAGARRVLAQRRVDLVLLDLRLPDGDGLELARALTAEGSDDAPCVVAVTAAALEQDRQRALEAGCHGYLTKPLCTRTFAAEVLGFLQRHDRSAA